MAYRLPTFNLVADMYRVPQGGGEGVFYGQTPCQVRGVSKLRFTSLDVQGGSSLIPNVLICLPPRTAVYGYVSDRFFQPDALYTYLIVGDDDPVRYRVMLVWDVAVGFSNEYRMVLCFRDSLLSGQ